MISFKSHLLELTAKPKDIAAFKKDAGKLKSVDTRDTTWKKSLSGYMANHGFKLLGSGKYASVYGNPKYPFVIKVFMKDAAFMKWLEFCLKNKDNPFVPRIKGKVLKITDLVYAIRIEKLESTSFSGPFAKEYQAWMRDSSYKSDDKNIQDILDFFTKHKKLLDLHSDNVMRRGSQLVVIDPFYNWFGKYEPGKYTIDPDDINDTLF